MISTTPEGSHFPIAKESMLAGKHVLLEKPMAIELAEADELIALSKRQKLLFTIAYSQRFNPKFAYIKRCLEDGTIGEPVTALVSRHITRNLGKKISGRVKLSPAAMESTHDIDFTMWCLAPRRPVRIYAQEAAKIMKEQYDAPDQVWMIITMNDGIVVTIGGGWVLPPAYPNFSSTWIEFIGTEGAVMVDDTHRDVYVTTTKDGIRFPISSMPGEKVNHVYAGPMEAETLSFLECVALGKEPLVTAEHARLGAPHPLRRLSGALSLDRAELFPVHARSHRPRVGPGPDGKKESSSRGRDPRDRPPALTALGHSR
jgi:predicted dehydrogenase